MQPITIYIVTFEAQDSARVLDSCRSIWSDPDRWASTWKTEWQGPSAYAVWLRRATRSIRRFLCSSKQAHQPEGWCCSFAVGGEKLKSMVCERLDSADIIYQIGEL